MYFWLGIRRRVFGRMPNTAGGTPTLPQELPVGKMRGPAEGIEECTGGGGTIAAGFGPALGPVDVILVGGRLDGQRDEALEEKRWRAGGGGGSGRCVPRIPA